VVATDSEMRSRSSGASLCDNLRASDLSLAAAAESVAHACDVVCDAELIASSPALLSPSLSVTAAVTGVSLPASQYISIITVDQWLNYEAPRLLV